MNTSQHLREQALQQLRAGQGAAAMATLKKLVKREPGDLPASLELADLLFRSGHFRDSSAPLVQASRHLPPHAPLILQLVQHLTARGEVVAARRCLDFLSRAPQPPAELLVAQAHLRFSLGEVEVALELIKQALAAGSDDPDDHQLHAMLLQFTGDIEAAGNVLERVIERWPHYGDAAMALVNLRRQDAASNRLDYLRDQLAQMPDGDRDSALQFVRAEFEYACFKTLDDLGEKASAWEALSRCNAIMRTLNPYQPAIESAVTHALVDTPALVQGVDAPSDGPRSPGPMPIFVVGMPRSGTTLLDRMLSSHSRVTTAGEISDFWRQLHWVADVRPSRPASLVQVTERLADIDFRQLGERYLEQTRWRAEGMDFFVDKLPANIQLVAFIRRALPQAPILHIVRDPMDVCFSNYKAMFGNTSPYSYDLEATAHYHAQYARVAEHWNKALPGAMHEVRYDALVRDPEAVMRGVLAHCGLAIEPACLHPERNAEPVATPSSTQVREPIHTRGIGQWQAYAEQLEPLRRALD